MAALSGMNLGPIMDWTPNNGLFQRYKIFKEYPISFMDLSMKFQKNTSAIT